MNVELTEGWCFHCQRRVTCVAGSAPVCGRCKPQPYIPLCHTDTLRLWSVELNREVPTEVRTWWTDDEDEARELVSSLDGDVRLHRDPRSSLGLYRIVRYRAVSR
jgi:hypothetical protein